VAREHKASGRRAHAIIQAELRDVETGKKHEERLRPSDRIEIFDVSTRHFNFIETNKETKRYTFEEDGERIELPCHFFGERGAYFQEGIEIAVRFVEERASPVFWNFTTLRAPYVIKETSPVLASYDNPRPKPAILENGRKIKVPPFIEEGETILVDLRTELFHSREE